MAPRVSEEYLEARREQILEAAWTCFTRTGFHRTTMQDICKQAQMSPGAVYRYFDSKEAIFEGIAEARLGAHDSRMWEMEAPASLFEMLATVIRWASEQSRESCATPGPGPVDVELWGEAITNERVRRVIQNTAATIRGNLTCVVELMQIRGLLDESLDTESVARLMMALFQGTVLQQSLGLELDLEKYLEVVAALSLPGPSTETAS